MLDELTFDPSFYFPLYIFFLMILLVSLYPIYVFDATKPTSAKC